MINNITFINERLLIGGVPAHFYVEVDPGSYLIISYNDNTVEEYGTGRYKLSPRLPYTLMVKRVMVHATTHEKIDIALLFARWLRSMQEDKEFKRKQGFVRMMMEDPSYPDIVPEGLVKYFKPGISEYYEDKHIAGVKMKAKDEVDNPKGLQFWNTCSVNSPCLKNHIEFDNMEGFADSLYSALKGSLNEFVK